MSDEKSYQPLPSSIILQIIASGSEEQVQSLINQNIIPRRTLYLFTAAQYGRLNVVQYILEGRRLHDALNTALRFAVIYGHLNIVQYLVEEGANIHANDEEVLRIAVENNHLNIVRYLIGQGADFNYIVNESDEDTVFDALGINQDVDLPSIDGTSSDSDSEYDY